MDGRTETFYFRRAVQRSNLNLIKITGSETCIGTVGDMTNVSGFVPKGICNDAIDFHGIGSQNNPIHHHRIMTAFRMQVSLEAIYDNQIGQQDAVQLGDGFVQVNTMECGLHRSGHRPLKILKTAGDQGLMVGFHNGHVDEKITFKNGSGNFQAFKRAFNTNWFLNELIPLKIDQA
jgi:hypothetical protein